jgi:hypothetical protein
MPRFPIVRGQSAPRTTLSHDPRAIPVKGNGRKKAQEAQKRVSSIACQCPTR